MKHADCAAHLVNLIVKKALKQAKISEILAKCRHIVSHFKHSNLAKKEFRDIQMSEDLPQHMLLQGSYLKIHQIYNLKLRKCLSDGTVLIECVNEFMSSMQQYQIMHLKKCAWILI